MRERSLLARTSEIHFMLQKFMIGLLRKRPLNCWKLVFLLNQQMPKTELCQLFAVLSTQMPLRPFHIWNICPCKTHCAYYS